MKFKSVLTTSKTIALQNIFGLTKFSAADTVNSDTKSFAFKHFIVYKIQ